MWALGFPFSTPLRNTGFGKIVARATKICECLVSFVRFAFALICYLTCLSFHHFVFTVTKYECVVCYAALLPSIENVWTASKRGIRGNGIDLHGSGFAFKFALLAVTEIFSPLDSIYFNVFESIIESFCGKGKVILSGYSCCVLPS